MVARMAIEARAIALIRETEGRLRDLVTEGASTGDYAGTIRAATLAKALAELAGPKKLGERLPVDRPAPAKAGVRRTPKPKYPRFVRRGDQLVRLAWSKRAKGEYEHKAAASALKALTAAILEAGKAGRIVSTEKLLPIVADGTEVPNYQAYVCLGFLRDAHLVEQHGRQGYSVPDLPGLVAAVEAAWQGLPTR